MNKKIKKILQNLLLLLGGLLFFFLMLEVGLRIFFPQTLSIATFDENYGLSMKANTEIMFYNKQLVREFGHSVKTNSDGLREDVDYSFEEDGFRILSIGDSFTFGNGVESNETFTKLLEKQLKEDSGELEVINFGVSGIEPSHYYKRLEHKGLKYHPDMVLVNIFVGNDFGYEIETVNFKPNNPNPLPFWIASKSHAFKFLYVLMNNYAKPLLSSKEKPNLPTIYSSTERYNKIMNSFREAVPEFNKLAKQNGIELVFVILPDRGQVDDNLWEKLLDSHKSSENASRFQVQKDLQNIFDETNSKYIDTTPFLVKLNKNNTFYYNIDGHLNTKGHELVGSVLYSKLKTEIP